MSDTMRMVSLLRNAGPKGIHTHTFRARGISGNPSQRATDAEALGYTIRRERERRNGRPGSRFFLTGEPAEVAAGAAPPEGRRGDLSGASSGAAAPPSVPTTPGGAGPSLFDGEQFKSKPAGAYEDAA